MTFASEANKFCRKPFVIMELHMDTCAETYGVLPCTANDPNKCFNTFTTCGDVANFNRTDKVFYFSDIRLNQSSQQYQALILSVDTAPTEILKSGMSVRANCTVRLADTCDNDTLVDPYPSSRNYIATTQGTFWGRFLARNRHYYKRKMVIKYGFIEEDGSLASVETYTYLIDQMSYDTRSGNFTVKGKDPLTLSDALKSKTPAATNGKLTATLAVGGTSFNVGTDEGAQYKASGRVAIGKEIIAYSRTGDAFTVTGGASGRGIEGTTAAEHSSGSTVQEVRFWDAVRVDLVLQDLLEDDAGIDSVYVPITDWDAEADDWLGTYILSANIMKPIEVNKLVGEIVEQCSLAFFSDDRDGAKIKLLAQVPLIGADLAAVQTFTDDSIIKDSLSIVDDTKSRISSVWFNHSLIDPSESGNKQTNFAVTEVKADAIAESANAYNQQQIKEIYSRWIRSSGAASLTNTRLLARFVDVPKIISFELDASFQISVGNHFFGQFKAVQDYYGSAATIEYQCTSVDYDHKRNVFKVKGLQFRFSEGRKATIAPNSTANYTAASATEKADHVFICDSTTLRMSNGDEPYLIA